MKIAISCCTPYHIFNAINLKINKYSDSEMDIFICNHFLNSKEIFKNVKESNIFKNVYYIEDLNRSSFIYKKMVWLKCYNGIFDKRNKRYDMFCFSSYSAFNISIASYLKQKFNSEVVFVEDGFITYTKEYESNYGWFKMKLGKIFNIFNKNIIDKYMVYNTNLICFETNRYIDEIPIIKKEDINIFEVDENINKFQKYKYIFFDQKFDSLISSELKASIIKEVLNYINKNNVIIKSHPRECLKVESEVEYYNSTIPWELISFRNNFDNKVFISFTSTACFTNTLIFNSYAIIILLHKLINYTERTGDYKFELFINKVKQNNNVEIYEPSSIQELGEIIKMIEHKHYV